MAKALATMRVGVPKPEQKAGKVLAAGRKTHLEGRPARLGYTHEEERTRGKKGPSLRERVEAEEVDVLIEMEDAKQRLKGVLQAVKKPSVRVPIGKPANSKAGTRGQRRGPQKIAQQAWQAAADEAADVATDVLLKPRSLVAGVPKPPPQPKNAQHRRVAVGQVASDTRGLSQGTKGAATESQASSKAADGGEAAGDSGPLNALRGAPPSRTHMPTTFSAIVSC